MPTHSPRRWLIATAAGGLLIAALFLPIWVSSLSAPQYPEGLRFVAYGHRVAGDLEEIDTLNHYVGMRPFRTDDLPEMALWPVGMAAAFAAVGVSTLTRHRSVTGRLARLYLWMFPVSILAVIQFRLHQFGHDLDPSAAFRMDGFTPWVIGPTNVWNFTAWSRPGAAIFTMLGAAALMTFAPRITRRIGPRGDAPRATAAVGAAILALGALALPAAASAPGEDLAALIAATPEGGTLVLSDTTYHGNVVVDRSITIEGTGASVIQGTGVGSVVTVTAPGVTLRGIRVTGSGAGPTGTPAGIRIEAAEATIDGVAVDDAYLGIAVMGGDGVRIVDSIVTGRGGRVADGHALGDTDLAETGGTGDGISLWDVDGALIRGTTIEASRDGVFVSFGSGALIDGNVIASNRYGVHSMFATQLTLVENLMHDNLSAAVLMYGGPALVLRNTLVDSTSPSTGFGLILKDVADVEVVENVLARNRAGVHLDGPAGGDTPVQFTANTIARNQIGVVLYPASTAVFMANSLVDNVVQVSRQGRGAGEGVVWNARGHGNYWSTYQGFDNGRGKGRTAHVEGGTVDRLIVATPILAPLATSPAMRIVDGLETRWGIQRPVAVDPLPLMHPTSPPVPQPPTGPAAGVLLLPSGIALAVAGILGLRIAGRRQPQGLPA